MIEIKHLKTLQALRNSGSLAGAAAALHQTQSALSHQFSDLEQRLGFRLFVRKSQPLRFTPQGEILLQLANQVLPQISRALQDCNEPQQTRLRIAIECHSCIQWLTPALESFRARWPHVEVDFQSGVIFDPQPGLQQGELDQGLVVTKTLGEGLWSRLYAAVRDGEQRQPVTEAFIRSARNHACDHLPFVRSAERPSVDGPIARPGSPERQ